MPDFYYKVGLSEMEESFLQRMNKLRKEGLFCDVNFDIEGKLFPCHRLVLTSASRRYFKKLFSDNFAECKLPTVKLEEVDPSALEAILTAIYTREIEIRGDNVFFILKASHLMTLDDIVNVCITHIMENPTIDYLIETCMFAKLIDRNDLYTACIQKIADELVDFGKTDAIMKISIDDFIAILEKGDYVAHADAIFLIIVRWCKYTKCSNPAEIIKLTEAAKLVKKIPFPALTAALFVSSNEDFSSEHYVGRKAKQVSDRKTIEAFPFNVHLKAITVHTGTKGWISLKLNNEFDECSANNFQPMSSFCEQKVFKIAERTYCFEYNWKEKKNRFFYIEDNLEFVLGIPSSYLEMEDVLTFNNKVYFIDGSSKLYEFNCDLDTWRKITMRNERGFNERTYNEGTYNGRAYIRQSGVVPEISHSDKLFLIDNSIIGKLDSEKQQILGVDIRSGYYLWQKKLPFTHVLPGICGFNKKVAITGSYHGDILHKRVDIFDTVGQGWPTVNYMNFGRSNHELIHRNGMLYAIENKLMIPNEKYNISSNKWVEIPSFPERIFRKSIDDSDITLATGDVIGVDFIE